MDFGEALKALKIGSVVKRTGWNGRGMYLMLMSVEQSAYMTMPYIYMSTVHGDFVPWTASQTDLLAEDWALLDQLE